MALVAETIRTSAVLAGHTERHRQYVEQGKASAASREKRACPCFAVSVRFAGGKGRDNIREWTSLCMADFDHIPAERLKECAALACADPHTLLAYTTVSGQGLRIVSLYAEGPVGESLSPERLHALAFTQMNEHYSTLTGKENTAIAGYSMGGREAMLTAFAYQDIFGWVGAFSSASFGTDVVSASDYVPDFTLDKGSDGFYYVQITVGGLDTLAPVSRNICARLDEIGVEYTYNTVFLGMHSPSVWRSALNDFVKNIFTDPA